MSRLKELLNEIRELEVRIADEISKEADEFGYTIKRGKVLFDEEISNSHRQLTKTLGEFLGECSWPGLLVSPVVYSLIIPVLIFDVFVFVYQLVCFPAYKIPKVRRRDYIALDRHKLQYLNIIERFNCLYCGYVGGFISYVQEVAARSEQYWCPIKHAKQLEGAHSRYHDFLTYGDADAYVTELHRIRQQLRDNE
ncbi:MAG: hypothetical protein OQK72_03125 [Gammaproteobacteria bacterium]|nr:hypothetical protein [Gammaproteobacteria bacterium]MCW9003758.1 hypothetical protein [Gammaproteobacteria bacterium]MCW9056044.1 hypothetical protein [Gammaproteobacteria bacterium]